MVQADANNAQLLEQMLMLALDAKHHVSRMLGQFDGAGGCQQCSAAQADVDVGPQRKTSCQQHVRSV